MCLIDGKHQGASQLAFRIALSMLQKLLTDEPIASRRENLPLKVTDLVVLLAFINGDSPALIREGLRRDVRPDIVNLRQAEEGAFVVLHRIHDVVPERRLTRLAP